MIIGCDPSLTGFGISDGERHERIETKAGVELRDRCAQIVSAVRAFVDARGVVAWTVPAGLNISNAPGSVVRVDDMHDLKPIREPMAFFIEAPAPGVAAGQSNPYDRGWLDCDLHRLAHFLGASVTMVTPGTWLKYITGKGNFPKDRLALFCFKKFGVEIEDDKGSNKLEAFCIQRYGAAVLSGEIAHVPIAMRGAGKKTPRGTHK